MSSNAERLFPCAAPAPARKKAAGIRRRFVSMTGLCECELQPLGAAAVAATIPFRTSVAVKAAVTAIAAAKSAMMPAAAAEAAFHPGQDREAALLAVVKRLVERIGGVRDLLDRGCSGAHRVGGRARPGDRIAGSLTVAIVVAHRVHPRIGAVDPQLCEFLHGGL